MNLSKKNDPRYWELWAASGAVMWGSRGWDGPSPTLLLPNHYRVSVKYEGVPSMEQLKKEWSCLSGIFDGRPFIPHPSCARMDRTPGDRMFYVHNAGTAWEAEEQIAWGAKQRNAVAPNGYRPATHDETYEFHRANIHVVDIVGLGSFAEYEGRLCVACVLETRDGPYAFSHRWAHQEESWLRILFVCK